MLILATERMNRCGSRVGHSMVSEELSFTFNSSEVTYEKQLCHMGRREKRFVVSELEHDAIWMEVKISNLFFLSLKFKKVPSDLFIYLFIYFRAVRVPALCTETSQHIVVDCDVIGLTLFACHSH